MVAALALGANVERRGGSSPFCRTKKDGSKNEPSFFYITLHIFETKNRYKDNAQCVSLPDFDTF